MPSRSPSGGGRRTARASAAPAIPHRSTAAWSPWGEGSGGELADHRPSFRRRVFASHARPTPSGRGDRCQHRVWSLELRLRNTRLERGRERLANGLELDAVECVLEEAAHDQPLRLGAGEPAGHEVEELVAVDLAE